MKYFLLIILFISCTPSKRTSDLDVISIDNTSDQVEIETKTSTAYGPNVNNEFQDEDKGKKSDVIALVLYPTIYESLAILPLLKQIDKKNEKISVISSFGFGAVISALYAKEKSVSYVEWKLFDLLKQIKPLDAYGAEWKDTIIKFVKDEFGDLKVYQLKALLIVPEISSGNMKLNQSEKVITVIERTLELASKSNLFLNPELIGESLSQVAVDKVLNVFFLPKYPTFKRLQGYNLGVLTSYLGKMKSTLEVESQISVNKQVTLDTQRVISKIEEDYKELITMRYENFFTEDE